MKIYKKVVACILTLMMLFAQIPVNVFATSQKSIPLDIVLVLDVSGSMDDPIGGGNGTKRIAILKASFNQLIDAFAENNSKQSDEKYQSRISIIKFAGNKSDKVGNDTYTESGYRHNYTQVMSNFFTATNKNKNELKDVVNSISPSGATQSNGAMELAQGLIKQSKDDKSRKDTKRIVLFLTDGQPTSFSNFDDDVANGAIKASKEIKKDAEVYTFGMFSETNPSITGHQGSGSWLSEEKFNAYMHGISSNYPDAESYKNLGTRAKNSDYYMGVKSYDEATEVFNSVINKLLSMTYAGADYTNVDAAINRANSLNKNNYKDFSKVEKAINEVDRNKDITEQEIVNGYAKAINEAIDQLEYKDADYTKVTEAIAKANNLNKDNYEDFTEVEKAINAVVSGKNITQQDEVDAMAKAINDAINALKLKAADYSKVEEAKKKIPSDLTLYTDETVQALKDTLDEVKYNLDITKQNVVDGYAAAINDAINALKLKVADYSKVEEAKKKIPSDLTLYTNETVNALKEALDAVTDNLDITKQDTVDGYAKAINKAIAQLKYRAADYTAVDKAIAKANKLNKDNYKDFTEVEKAINAVVPGKNITQQAEVDAMADAINNAINALVFQLKIKYDANGGTGTMTDPAIELDKEFTFPKCEYVAPKGKHFKGWQVDSTIYKVGDKRVFTKDNQNKEIKAVWEEHTFDQKLKEVNSISTLKKEATCTTDAIYYKSCTCGQVSTTETFEDVNSKLGHDYTKQIKDVKYLKSQGSNCQEHDIYWYACSRCDASAKDDENAQDKYYEDTKVGNHVFSKDWNKDSDNHWHSCTVSGCNEVADKGNHVYDQEVESSEYLATPATCMTPARYYKSCTCGAKGTEAFAATGTHLGHAYIEVKNPQFLRKKAINCKEHDTYWYVCSRCGKTSQTINKYYEDKDSKGEHISSDWIIDQQPTVAKEGSKHKECTVCKEVLETEKIAKLENVKTETKKEETTSKKETKVESKKVVTTGDNTNSLVPMTLLGISLLGIYIIVMKKYVR